jgi:hypothetical protein
MQLTLSLKAPGFFQPLNLTCDLLVSKFAFIFNFQPLQFGGEGGWVGGGGFAEALVPGTTVGLCTLNQVDP